jgi:16S rRNA (guanine527-N7)-methyltransferase
VATSSKIKKGKASDGFSNGILYLKGGDLTEELVELGKKHKVFELSSLFKEEFFESKKVVYVPM